jgi:DNA processing protein
LQLTNEELKYRIALTLIPGIGDVLGKKLVAYCGSVEGVFKQKKAALLKIPGIGNFFANAVMRHSVFGLAEKEMRFIEQERVTTLFYLDENYPERLKQCADGPMMLYYKGNAVLNNKRVLGIVGTRNATEYGKDRCGELLTGLASQNLLIVSGLAYGIDIYAHRSCLKHGIQTVAVLAHGLDVIYPPLHCSTAHKMVMNGGLLTDYTSRTRPDKENFPRRNRIVAGMCDAVVVIESAVGGGSMITAEIAGSYSRDVYAFPGRTGDMYSAGCNKLIKENKAGLIENADDLVRMLGWEEQKTKIPAQCSLFAALTEEEEKIVEAMKGKGNVHIDEISILAQLPVQRISALLLNLEFTGVLKSLPGKMYRLN